MNNIKSFDKIRPIKKESIDGKIMHKDTCVAIIKNSRVDKILVKDLCPFKILRDGFEQWLEGRSIDTHRTNSRLLRKVLRISDGNEIAIVLSVHAISITDNWWFLRDGENYKYDKIRFSKDYLAATALHGKAEDMPSDKLTPQLSLNGSYEKCWYLQNGRWVLAKTGRPINNIAEIVACTLGRYLGFDMAKYWVTDAIYETVYSEDFTNSADVDYEPISSLVDEEEDFETSFKILYELMSDSKSNLVKQFQDILFMDAILYNYDRHTENYGILRNVNTGAIISMAPNFDNNNALSLIIDKTMAPTGFLDMYVDALKDYSIPNIDKKDLYNLLYKNFNNLPQELLDKYVEFIYNNYLYLKEKL